MAKRKQEAINEAWSKANDETKRAIRNGYFPTYVYIAPKGSQRESCFGYITIGADGRRIVKPGRVLVKFGTGDLDFISVASLRKLDGTEFTQRLAGF